MANLEESESRRRKNWGRLLVGFGSAIELLGPQYSEKDGVLLFVLGMIVCAVGLAIFAHAKGRSLAVSALALWPVFGPVIGLFIRDQQAINEAAALAQADPKIRRLAVIKWTAFLILFVPSVIVSSKYFVPDPPVHDVGKDVSPSFPIVALTQNEDPGSYQVYLLHMYELPDFTKQHGDFTFLIPEESATLISAGLSSKYTYNSPDNSSYDFMTFRSLTVKKIEEGKLLIEVHARTSAGEADLAGWYEASDKTIVPKKVLYYHDMAKMVPFMVNILLAWLVSYALAFGILPLLVNKVWAKSTSKN